MMSAEFFAALLDRLALIAMPLVGIAMVVVAQYRIKRKPERGTTLIWTAAGGGLVFSTGLDSVLRWFVFGDTSRINAKDPWWIIGGFAAGIGTLVVWYVVFKWLARFKWAQQPIHFPWSPRENDRH